ncbi:unnamed protein product [Oppiella nova]|uniref:Peptide chain release factor domain-containing protein n=1 Tax=Oppiella nova TaxID=334625 RepID=A0A7R9M2N1_9ACAR|nr:unnamed protein product [Oppiella nova]CAG2169589.1 unnamed protein product [Oppiella nova]
MFGTKCGQLVAKCVAHSLRTQLRHKSYDLSSHKLRQFLSQNSLRVSVPAMKTYESTEHELNELMAHMDEQHVDKELRDLMDTERHELTDRMRQLVDSMISDAMFTADDRHISECCLDVNCGVGGQEAMLFTKELLDVYVMLCDHQRWKYSMVANDCDTDFGGTRHSSLIISGTDCYRLLRHEAGVHRVQRFPKTDRHRVHTSTATVSVIPVRHDVIDIKDSDLVFKMTTSQGAGGQHVNRTLTCVRVTHTPTGVSTECQETRSQLQNKDIALRKLKAIINEMAYEKKRTEEVTTKRAQVGIAARSDKIRTYNFPQNRITDHRLGDDIHDIEVFMKGGSEKLLYFLNKLEDQRQRLVLSRISADLDQFLS